MAFWTLYKRELNSYFQSAVAYIVLFGSAIAQGLVFQWIVGQVIGLNFKEANVLQIFFTFPLFWILLIMPVPFITMRLFSEEFKLGTIEMLLTAPVREWDVVLAKFFGALTFFMILWLPITLDLISLQLFSAPPPPIFWSQILLTAMTLTLIGGLYVSLGVFASVLTKNQIVSAVICFVLIFAFFIIAFERWDQHLEASTLARISYVSLLEHLQNATLGIFDSRPIVYYVTTTAFFLMLTQRILQGRRLKG